MKIYFIAEEGHYKKWGPKNYFDLLTHIEKYNKKHEIILFFSDENILDIKEKPDLIVFFDTDSYSPVLKKFEFVFNWKIPIAIALLDMFYPNQIRNCPLIKKTFSIIHFGKAVKLVEYYQKIFPEKYITYFKSRFINRKRFKDYKQEKTYDIMFYGTRKYYHDFKSENIDYINEYINKKYTNPPKEINFYPLRERLENLLKNYQHKYKILFLPEKNSHGSNITNENLSKLINKSYLVVACSTIADICMHKYFEIAGSHSTILGDIPTSFGKLFKDKICEVNEFMSDEEILNKIDNFLSNKKKLNKFTDELYEQLHKEHNYDEAIENFNNIFEKIVSEYKK